MNSNLRRARLGQKNWTKEQIVAGIEYFFELHERYPTAVEIDSFEYLPSSRSIQRSYDGLVLLRTELVPKSHTNFTKGTYRSSMAKVANDRAKKYEEEFYNFLSLHFESIAIHEHKVIRPGGISSDYFIHFDEDKGAVIDLFYAQDIHSLAGIIGIKLKRYILLSCEVYFILVGNPDITKKQVDALISRRKIALPSHISIDTEINFKDLTIFKLKAESNYSRN